VHISPWHLAIANKRVSDAILAKHKKLEKYEIWKFPPSACTDAVYYSI
jgi:hypothetical protein